ncbi:MAG: ATP-dependent sacrificial sulfur transferase LarE [Desulfarculus sp.]|nr:ATP-dependent sacrificial sulfur transferase LarE [Desulfarculus sp.]
MPPSADIPPDLRDTWQALLEDIRGLAPLVVAFSGGADSSLLLAAATQALGQGVKAAICLGPLTPPWEADRARQLAAHLGAELVELQAGEINDPDIVANDSQRCYYCKRLRLTLLTQLARQWGLASVVEGSQVDDAQDFRPGSRAVKELGVYSPLARAGLDKAAVRRLSQALGLVTAQVPSGACLATRVPTGTRLSAPALERIGQAEQAVRALLPGRQVRVRDHFPLARLELEPDVLPRAASQPLRGRLLAALLALGYAGVCLDLAGYRPSGGPPAGPGQDGPASRVSGGHPEKNQGK